MVSACWNSHYTILAEKKKKSTKSYFSGVLLMILALQEMWGKRLLSRQELYTNLKTGTSNKQCNETVNKSEM